MASEAVVPPDRGSIDDLLMKEEYMNKLEEKLKEHRRKKQEKTKTMTIPMDSGVVSLDDSTDSWRSFAETSSKNIENNLNTTKSKPTLSTSPEPVPPPIPTKPPVTIASSGGEKTEKSKENDGGGLLFLPLYFLDHFRH